MSEQINTMHQRLCGIVGKEHNYIAINFAKAGAAVGFVVGFFGHRITYEKYMENISISALNIGGIFGALGKGIEMLLAKSISKTLNCEQSSSQDNSIHDNSINYEELELKTSDGVCDYIGSIDNVLEKIIDPVTVAVPLVASVFSYDFVQAAIYANGVIGAVGLVGVGMDNLYCAETKN